MAHKWHSYQPKDKMKAVASNHHRECHICGARQSKQTTQSWGRITGYQWYPLAGRCTGLKNRECWAAINN